MAWQRTKRPLHSGRTSDLSALPPLYALDLIGDLHGASVLHELPVGDRASPNIYFYIYHLQRLGFEKAQISKFYPQFIFNRLLYWE
jgi:hypothetical protein